MEVVERDVEARDMFEELNVLSSCLVRMGLSEEWAVLRKRTTERLRKKPRQAMMKGKSKCRAMMSEEKGRKEKQVLTRL